MSVLGSIAVTAAKTKHTLCSFNTWHVKVNIATTQTFVCVSVLGECVCWSTAGGGVQAPVLCRLILRRWGKSLWGESSGSWIDERELLARMRETRPGYMRPSLRTSTHSCSWLSVICSSRRDGHGTDDMLTLSNSFKHRNNSSSLHTQTHTHVLVHGKIIRGGC